MSDNPLTEVRRLARDMMERDANYGDVYRKIRGSLDAVVLEVAVDFYGGNRVRMAEALGLSRTTIRAMLRRAGLVVDARRGAERVA